MNTLTPDKIEELRGKISDGVITLSAKHMNSLCDMAEAYRRSLEAPRSAIDTDAAATIKKPDACANTKAALRCT